MENKVVELVGVMVSNKEAKFYFMDNWYSLYSYIMSDPIGVMEEGEQHRALNKICGVALFDWYEHQEA